MNEAATALGTTPPTPLAPTHTHDTSHPHPYIKSDSSSEKMFAPCQNTPGIVCSPRIGPMEGC